MSIHAQLAPETLRLIQAQQRNSTVSSIIISVLTLFLIGIILLWILLPAIENYTPEVAIYQADSQPRDEPVKPKIPRVVQPNQSSPSPTEAKAIAVNMASDFSIPTPDNIDLNFATGFGDDDGFGDDWGNGVGTGIAGGYGSPTKLEGTISGHLYDFKQNSSGEPVVGYNTKVRSHFTDPINKLHRSKFSHSSLRNFYQAEQQLNIRYIAIPFSNASDGPRFFGAEKEVRPSGWIANYQGKVTAPKSGTFRLVGAGDDYLSVTINNKFRLVAAWSDIQESVAVRGANTRNAPHHQSALGTAPLTYGTWFNVKEGQTLDLNITLGERPGGKVGFMLMIEEKGADYQKTPDGRNILPPFTVGALSPEDHQALNEFPNWEWETHNIPVFKAVN